MPPQHLKVLRRKQISKHDVSRYFENRGRGDGAIYWPSNDVALPEHVCVHASSWAAEEHGATLLAEYLGVAGNMLTVTSSPPKNVWDV